MSVNFLSIIQAFHQSEAPVDISRQALAGLMSWMSSSGYVALHEVAALSEKPADINQLADFVTSISIQRETVNGISNKMGKSACFYNNEMRLLYLNIFYAVMSGNQSYIDMLKSKEDGKLALELMGCDEQGNLSLEILARQAQHFPTRKFQEMFKTDHHFNAYLEETYNFVVMSNSVILLQRLLEDGHDANELFEVFSKRNAKLLHALGAHGSVAIPMGRFLACKAFYPYPRERWPSSVSPLDMLGAETYELSKMVNFRDEPAWMVSPVAESSWFKKDVRNVCDPAYMGALAQVEMDSRRLFTSGMDYLLENSEDPQVARYAGYATQLIVDELEDGKALDLGMPYVINVLNHQQGPCETLCTRVIDFLLTDDGKEYLTFQMLEWVKEMSGPETFQRSAIKVIAHAPKVEGLELLVALMEKSDDAIAQASDRLKRLFIEDELGM